MRGRYTLSIFLGHTREQKARVLSRERNTPLAGRVGGPRHDWLLFRSDDIQGLKSIVLPGDEAYISEMREGELWYVAEHLLDRWTEISFKFFDA